MNWEAWKPLVSWAFRIGINAIGVFLMTHGTIKDGAGLETFLGMATSAGATFWSWWVTDGHIKAAAFLQNITNTATQAAAIEVAKRLPISAVPSDAVQMAKVQAAAIEPAVMAKDAAATVVKIILVVFVVSMLLAADQAHAQTRPRVAAPAVTGDLKKDINTDAQNLGLVPKSLQVQPTGNVAADLKTLWDKIVSASNTDLAYASKLAASAGTQSAGIRKQCWDAIVALNEQANGLNLKNPDGTPVPRPDPHLFTDVETLAEVVDNLSPQGPLFVSCAGAAQLAKTNVLTFINAAVTGAAGIAAMPIIPGL